MRKRKLPEGDQLEESREQQDTGGEDICENGEEEEATVMREASGMAGNATEPEDVPAEAASEQLVPAKPKRSSHKKKAVTDKAEKEDHPRDPKEPANDKTAKCK